MRELDTETQGKKNIFSYYLGIQI